MKPVYFCSVECLNEGKNLPAVVVTETEEEGLETLARVREALSKAVYVEVDPALIRPLPGQPRVYFNEDALAGMILSIKRVGQIQPGTIRRIPKDSHGRIYELLDGERRWRSINHAGIHVYRAMLVDIDDAAAPFVVSIISNFNRQPHTVLEEVDAIVKMHDVLKIGQQKIAEMMGLSPVYVSQLYGLRRLSQPVRDMLDPAITPGAKLLPKTAAIHIAAAFKDEPTQVLMANRMVNKEVTVTGLIRELRESTGRIRQRGPVETRQVMVTKLRRINLMLADLNDKVRSEAGRNARREGFSNEEILSLTENGQSAHKLLAACLKSLGIEETPTRS